MEKTQVDLFDAVKRSDLYLVKSLIKKTDVNGEDEHGRTPLSYALDSLYNSVYGIPHENGYMPQLDIVLCLAIVIRRERHT